MFTGCAVEGRGALEPLLCSWEFQLCIWDKVDLDQALASLGGGYHWHKSAGLLGHGCDVTLERPHPCTCSWEGTKLCTDLGLCNLLARLKEERDDKR